MVIVNNNKGVCMKTITLVRGPVTVTVPYNYDRKKLVALFNEGFVLQK